MNNKIVLIGCGNVGMSYAYALLNQRTNVQTLCLIDLNKDRIEGEVMDLNHCLANSPSKINIKVGDYSDCTDASIVVICAGANQNVGETRMNLINKNSRIFKNIVTEVMKNDFKGIFLVATNPLDVMTYLTWKYSGLPSNRIIGTGTILDTARLRYLIGNKLKINPKNVHAYVIGEHGDSEFVPFSNATVGIQSIKRFINDYELEQIQDEVKNAAYKIIEKKGATYYGIGMCLVRITNAILSDENSIITVSTYDKDNKIFIGYPAVINNTGIASRIRLDLNNLEIAKYNHSVNTIKDAIKKI